MVWSDVSLVLAGTIGSGVAVVHGVLVERLMVRPFKAAFSGDRAMSRAVKRLVPLLLHFSTVSWFLGGLALIATAMGLGRDARLATATLVGALFLFGAAGNLWATRGRHPGGMLMAAAVALIALGVADPG